ncbi:hypothetical protein WMY93_010593 [Mugilogobius chulae]|uniref:OCIA domain-containing protein 1 n=1 Tax=Mugilogobius chulae TaxID=88201 RepID=A0AAW0PGS7_9GOBI
MCVQRRDCDCEDRRSCSCWYNPCSTANERLLPVPISDHHVHREDVRKVWKECQDESFWYRALPISLGSMAMTGGLIYNGVWKSSARFGPFPKLAVAGILGYAVGKLSYMGACRNKFQELGIKPPGGPWGAGGPGGPGGRHGHEHRLTHALSNKNPLWSWAYASKANQRKGGGALCSPSAVTVELFQRRNRLRKKNHTTTRQILPMEEGQDGDAVRRMKRMSAS